MNGKTYEVVPGSTIAPMAVDLYDHFFELREARTTTDQGHPGLDCRPERGMAARAAHLDQRRRRVSRTRPR
jgi:hypothetical protein